MIRYRLDDLGWFQFEWLVQSLLKAECGAGVESWGGHGDHGRDAYAKGPLNFPSKYRSRGPFVFQAKFIENANAAGAKFEDALLAAVSKEAERIRERRSKGQWKKPRYYILLTNALIPISARKTIKSILRKAIPDTAIVLLGGNDLSDLLDQHENLRRSFPQLLSLRDLDELIQRAASKEALERSRSAVESAREIVPIFVPTAAYTRAWKVLHDYGFVVLEGPPEMGKTAIAWMIALTLLSQGWQAIACDKPEDFFKLYDSEARQVFVADDAFGRTEYDPARGVEWERFLDRVIHRLDTTHWLVWTSRKHILERALRTMDLQGKARSFPSSAAVLVDANKLSTREKALVLYRHARSAGFEQQTRDLIKTNAHLIVRDRNFTPERIRRFIKEVVPDLVAHMGNGELDQAAVRTEIHKAIQTPTDRMRKSFEALPNSHKMLLISLLEAGDYPSPGTLQALYKTHARITENQLPFESVVEELSESFIKAN